jgi:hypothetical protein
MEDLIEVGREVWFVVCPEPTSRHRRYLQSLVALRQAGRVLTRRPAGGSSEGVADRACHTGFSRAFVMLHRVPLFHVKVKKST